MSERISLALAGNPNSGKTTIFNAIVGARHHVGNYPGVTVEKREGSCRYRERRLDVTDLPGMYSLTPYSIDERVARDHVIDSPPDVVVDVIDCTNLERNLYLAVQLREMGVPLVLAFNMSDLAASRGIHFDLEDLSRRLGVPIVRTTGNKGEGIQALLDAVVEAADSRSGNGALAIEYGSDIDAEVDTLERVLAKQNGHFTPDRRRWMALNLLESAGQLPAGLDSREIVEALEAGTARVKSLRQEAPSAIIANRRYEFVSAVCEDTVRFGTDRADRRTARIDAVLTHRVWGLPIFLGLMYLVFQMAFTLAGPMADGIETACQWLGGAVTAAWPAGADSPLMSLIVDGVIAGVGGVLVFLPNIVLLFLAIAILEDSGYMARAAFMMDRLMSGVGLHGKSFIPMLLGFGCNVPAIMATRTLESRRDRMTTMLIIPFMSCTARLTIFALIIPAFFAPSWQAPVLWIVYITGIALAVGAAHILSKTVFSGESSGFLMELPAYHTPTARSVLTHMWERAWLYLKKAGTIILGMSVVLWALTTFPKKSAFDVDRAVATGAAGVTTDAPAPSEAELADARASEQLAHSIAGRLGHAMEPLLRPMGFDWRIGTALIGAFAAKEVFVAQMGIVYSVGEVDETSEALRSKLQRDYTPLVGFCILLFTLIATPCMATVAIMRRESNSWRWAFFQFGAFTAIGYVVAVIVYQVGRLLGIGI